MKILKKRILPGIMAGVLALSMAVPAFAANEVEGSTIVTGAYEDIEIEVSVPNDTSAKINPYGMPVEIGTVGGTNYNVSGEQIVSDPMFIINKSEVNVTVGAKVTATVQGGLRLTDTAPAADDVLKNAYVYLQVARATTLTNTEVATGSGNQIDGIVNSDAKTFTEFTGWKDAYNSSKDVLLTSIALGSENTNMVTLGAATINGGTTTVANTGIAKARLAGKVSSDPREAWTENDGFKATIAWVIKPDATSANITGELTIDNSASNATTTLTAALVGAPDGVTIKSVAWTSGTVATATVPATGTASATGADTATATVTAVADGTSVITATITASNDIIYTATVTVTVENT